MNPTIFDLSVNQQTLNTTGNTALISNTTQPGQSTAQDILNRLATPTTGRAYGVEVLIRREVKSGLFGWLSYSLSRSERDRNGSWVAYDFDRTHLVNLVAGLRLPRNWDLGLRFQYQSGTARDHDLRLQHRPRRWLLPRRLARRQARHLPRLDARLLH
jgi:hypothetical protein